MSRTRIFEHRNGVSLCAVAVLAAGMASVMLVYHPGIAGGQEAVGFTEGSAIGGAGQQKRGLAPPAQPFDVDQFGSQFYSFVPAKPDQRVSEDDEESWRNDLTRANRAYNKGEYKTARRHLEAASDKGSLIATWYLGHLYRLGKGTTADPGKAFQLYRQVAIAYDPDEPDPRLRHVMVDSLVRVADAYREGDSAANVAKDPARALRLYTAASGHRHPGASYGLGVMYINGSGVGKNTEVGLRWLHLAARKRFAPAELLLGDLYWQGDIVELNRSRAIMWYTLAQQTARPETLASIDGRLGAMIAESSEEERLAGVNKAQDWSTRFPVDKPPLPMAEE